MNRGTTVLLALVGGLVAGIPLGGRLMPASAPDDDDEGAAAVTAAAVADAIGAEDISGPYDVQMGWPKDLSTLPGHEQWTYGGARGIFAESPNRVYLLGGGELPNLKRPRPEDFDVGASVQFLVGCRGGTQPATPPGAGDPPDPPGWSCGAGRSALSRALASTRGGALSIVVDEGTSSSSDAGGCCRACMRYVSPHEWKSMSAVDDHTHAITSSTTARNSCRRRTLMSLRRWTHFNRPTFMAWPPDGFYVSMAITARASPSSTRAASSSSISE